MLRDLERVDYRVRETEIEAEVVELRLIAEHTPRYNRRSRPPRSQTWVKLTTERFPAAVDGSLDSRRRGAVSRPVPIPQVRGSRHPRDLDAVPIRRCTTIGTTRLRGVLLRQLGPALCPCDGSVDDEVYDAVVDQVRDGLTGDPGPMLGALRERMSRDSLELSDSKTPRRCGIATSRSPDHSSAAGPGNPSAAAGTLWAEDACGDGVAIRHGRLVGSWNARSQPPLVAAEDPLAEPAQTPESREGGRGGPLNLALARSGGCRPSCRAPERSHFRSGRSPRSH